MFLLFPEPSYALDFFVSSFLTSSREPATMYISTSQIGTFIYRLQSLGHLKWSKALKQYKYTYKRQRLQNYTNRISIKDIQKI